MIWTILLLCSTLIKGTIILGDSLSQPVRGTWTYQWKMENPDTEVIWKSGGTTDWLLDTLPSIPPNKRVIIFIGVNDVLHNNRNTEENIEKIINHIYAKCGQPVIVSGVYHIQSSRRYKEFVAYGNWNAKVIPPLLLPRNHFGDDGIHLNGVGHQRLYEWVNTHY